MAGVLRIQISQYKKSGRLVAIVPRKLHGAYHVLTLSAHMTAITDLQSRKYIKNDLLQITQYQIELRERVTERGVSYQIIRVLTAKDTSLDRWKTTESLAELPVSSEPELTIEERAWAGERDGNIAGGVALVLVTSVAVYFTATSQGFGSIVALLIGAITGWHLARYEWKRRTVPDPTKIEMLSNHKEALRNRFQSKLVSARSQLEISLEDFRTWAELHPREFELALSMRLEKAGYKLRTTRYSQDGGVDIEATSSAGVPTIVQAKKYGGKVGVSVVREMIGIRATRAERPHTIIYSLNGFSRGAKALAAQSEIELRDIKSELLRI